MKPLSEKNPGVLPGVFISVEGIEGVGKSTIVDFLADYLHGLGFEILKTRIRPGDVLLTQGAGNIGALAQQLSGQDWV